ncbi:RNA polymerase sigma factor [Dyadobacter frigoris]|uniref:RNA polymerase sigma-70 factor n=1 Tax=Dyadobacter frigoris TaxID=2576211 RepID=A0A4U6CXV8_9BACT|nr:RNA polymerase sigma-70 factor [Dyadobacter frigoris]TKT89552.1 RNA polymerase sigma-70 factor [Dyadobacter frigoris]GLU54235.1 DNA-directed RNA polymerase sigma-70 factor [Dyadobacter frigoris]
MNRILTDEQLVIELSEGNKFAFGEIYDRYWYKLFCIAYHQIGTKEEAEELVHDLFESLWNRREQSNIRHLSSYLVISMKNLITNFIKSQITWRKYKEYIILQKMQENALTENTAEFTDLSQALDNALKKLPEKTSKIFQLSRFENQSVKEIAKELNLSEKAVEYHITKSLKVLKDHLWIYHTQN